jgi:hypothetical protein
VLLNATWPLSGKLTLLLALIEAKSRCKRPTKTERNCRSLRLSLCRTRALLRPFLLLLMRHLSLKLLMKLLSTILLPGEALCMHMRPLWALKLRHPLNVGVDPWRAVALRRRAVALLPRAVRSATRVPNLFKLMILMPVLNWAALRSPQLRLERVCCRALMVEAQPLSLSEVVPESSP